MHWTFRHLPWFHLTFAKPAAQEHNNPTALKSSTYIAHRVPERSCCHNSIFFFQDFQVFWGQSQNSRFFRMHGNPRWVNAEFFVCLFFFGAGKNRISLRSFYVQESRDWSRQPGNQPKMVVRVSFPSSSWTRAKLSCALITSFISWSTLQRSTAFVPLIITRGTPSVWLCPVWRGLERRIFHFVLLWQGGQTMLWHSYWPLLTPWVKMWTIDNGPGVRIGWEQQKKIVHRQTSQQFCPQSAILLRNPTNCPKHSMFDVLKITFDALIQIQEGNKPPLYNRQSTSRKMQKHEVRCPPTNPLTATALTDMELTTKGRQQNVSVHFGTVPFPVKLPRGIHKIFNFREWSNCLGFP